MLILAVGRSFGPNGWSSRRSNLLTLIRRYLAMPLCAIRLGDTPFSMTDVASYA